MARRWRTPFPCGVMFHRFRGTAAFEWQGALTAEAFEEVLLAIGVENILSPTEWLKHLEDDGLRPGHVCVTFDDGLRSQIDHAKPVLDGYGVKAFWFVYSCVFEGIPVRSEIYSYAAALCGGMEALARQFLARCPATLRDALNGEAFQVYATKMKRLAPFYSDTDLRFRYLRNQEAHREIFNSTMDDLLRERGLEVGEIAAELWMTEAQLRRLTEDGHHVGLHSHDHPFDIGALPYEQQQRQYETNCAFIVQATGVRPTAVAHPLGSYSDASLAILRSLGVTCGFLPHAIADARGINPTRLELARLDPTDYFRDAH